MAHLKYHIVGDIEPRVSRTLGGCGDGGFTMATTHNHQPSFISEKHEMKREKIKLTYATRACTMEEVIRSRNMTLKGSNNDDIGPNGPIGINASSGDRSHANLGWCDKLVDEDSYGTPRGQ
ncbi:hypothetical protein V6N12_028635 [Hibiscus sabdariffa]|uniref:Uncharacterized protein n=1 Tax=Hibiscus sabdariffa TaxID=183260 RepID=A0ABR2F6D7_9ROSI